MASTISAFFSSLLPSYKAQTTSAQTRSESRATGSTSSAPSSTFRPAHYKEEGTVEWEANKTGSASVEPEHEPDAVSREEIRNLRAQFLDEKFSSWGKKKNVRAGKTFTSPKVDSQS
ncbi:hypothetical protein F5X99DRAFT_414203 [Biscogniauxia marginata]|nr:hypothetical protein F5X99DRAFT_414203 [Biscogniauxia marginata]